MTKAVIAYKPIGVIRGQTVRNGWQDSVGEETAQRCGRRRYAG